MTSIFWGLIFCNFDFNLNIGQVTLGLIPDFLGYYFIMKGLREVAHYSPFFEKTIPFTQGMAIYSAVLYLMDFLRIEEKVKYLPFGLGIIQTAVYLYILYNIVLGIQSVEQEKMIYLYGDKLKNAWVILVIFDGISRVFSFVPILTVPFILVSFFASLWFVYCFYRMKKQFSEIEY